MASLADTFRAPESRVTKVLMAIDLTDSTGMKQLQPEAAWLNTYGWFYDLIQETVLTIKGQVVKFVGDGAMIVFNEDNAADAINCAIVIQEQMAEARASNRVSCDCSIGIAYGEVVEFDTPEGTKDYLGLVVDRAFRLCSAANAKAIFVDSDTVAAAAMNKVRSRLGSSTVPKRKVVDYQGPEEVITAKGFARPIAYHEILWGTDRYGVSRPFVSDLSTGAPTGPTATSTSPSAHTLGGTTPASPPVSRQPSPAAAGWVRGRVSQKNERFGFIRGVGGEDYYFNADYLFRRDLDVRVGDEVWLLPIAPAAAGKAPRASDVVALGVSLEGVLEKVMPTGYGFAKCENQHGIPRQMFVFWGSADGRDWRANTPVRFKVGGNAKGFSGVEPDPLGPIGGKGPSVRESAVDSKGGPEPPYTPRISKL